MSTSTKPVFAELSEDGKHIEVYFKPDPKWLDIMHSISARFIGKDKLKEGEQPHWRLPLDFWAARDLSAAVGEKNLQLGDALNAWAWDRKEKEQLAADIMAREGKPQLTRLKKVLPDLYNAIWVGPKGKSMTPAEFKAALKEPASFQATDVEFMAGMLHPLNANQPGTGKTLELIASVYEAGLENGPHLVVAPVTSLDSVWEHELTTWQDMPVFRAAGEGMSRRERIAQMRSAELAVLVGRPFWLLVNPEMVRLKKVSKALGTLKENLYADWPWLADVEWSTVTLDECHKNAVRNLTSVTAKGLLTLKVKDGGKKAALSGTPVGGKPINLHGIITWLHPDSTPTRYQFGAQWLHTEEVQHSKRNPHATHTEIGDVREDKQADWDRMMLPLMVRRTKAEVLPWLPPKDYVPVWVHMTEEQQEQYVKFAKMAELELGDETLTATNVLAIYTRLKQFASAKQRFEDGTLIPTEDSGKVHALFEKLEELGIFDPDQDSQAVVGSQFTGMVNLITDMLNERGVKTVKITGQVRKRADAINEFQNDGTARVMVINTDAGGVSITLDKADSVHVLDEKWNPDDQEQLEDRVHRGSRIHQVTCYYYRTTGTVEEYIHQVTKGKRRVNAKLLDGIKLYKEVKS
jgi:SNF2 family DNA or RNA helicase